MKRIRVTADHRRDFVAYLRWRRHGRCFFRYPHGQCACFLPWREPPITRGTTDTVAAFAELESRGVMPAPRHPRVLAAVLEGKKLLNFQIKQWAEGMADPCVTVPAELRAAFPWLPDWVWRAVSRAVARAA